MTELNDNLYSLIMLTSMILIYLLLLFVFKALIPYLKQRKYIKGEMDRSFSEREYRYWKRKLKRLHLDYIPVIGGVIKRAIEMKRSKSEYMAENLCKYCKTGLESYELDKTSAACPYLDCYVNGECGMYKPIEKSKNAKSASQKRESNRK